MLKFENQSNGRYYYIYVERDLFDEHVLVIHRGGNNINVVRRYGFYNRDDLQKEIDKLYKRRIKNGYRLIQ